MKNSLPHWKSKVSTLVFLNFLLLVVGATTLWAVSQPKVSMLGAPQISTMAGMGPDSAGYGGDGAAATAAQLSYPFSVATDSAGNVYIADSSNYRIRVVNTQNVAITVAGVTIQPGNIATVAGNGTEGESGDGGAATSAQIGYVEGITVDSTGNIYFSDTVFSVVREINTSGTISIFAGTLQEEEGCGYYDINNDNGDGGPATSATFDCPTGVGVDATGNVYITDQQAGLVRQVNTQGIINTVAGAKGNETYCEQMPGSGDGGPATSAVFGCPTASRVDQNGNLFITDLGAGTIRVVNMQNAAITVNGVTIQPTYINTIAGTGTWGYTGDGGAATSAQLFLPYDAVVDKWGNVFIADSENDVIRKVDTNGIITTFAGMNGEWNYFGDGGPATAAELAWPTSVAVDTVGNVYIVDNGNDAVRQVNPNGGGSTTDFGSVSLGSNTTQAIQFYMSQAVTVSAIQANGDYTVTTNPAPGNKRHQSASRSASVPKGMPSVQAKFLQKAMAGRTSRPMDNPPTPNSCVGTFAQGDTCTAYVQFTPTKPGPRWFQLTATDSTQVNYTFGLTGTGVGSLVSITPGIINTPPGGAGVGALTGIVRDDFANTFVADYENEVVWKITSQGVSTIVAGIAGTPGYDGDGGPATSAHLYDPLGLTLDSVGNLYIADTLNNVVRKVDVSGTITTVAGTGNWGYSGDGGLATNAQLDNPLGVLADNLGNLYIADTFNNVVRKVDAYGHISTIAGNGTGAGSGGWQNGNLQPSGGWSGDSGPATQAELNGPGGLALDANGNLYISDTWNSAIRKVDASGNIWTVAGFCSEGCEAGYSGDGGAATSAQLNFPFGLAVDAAGDFYFADTDNSAIRKVDVNGVITTVAGGQNAQPTQQRQAHSTGVSWHLQAYNKKAQSNAKPHPQDSIGDGGLATSALIEVPVGLSVDNNGSFYLTDVAMGYLRVVDVTTSDMNFGTLNPGTTSDPLAVTVSDTGNASLNVSQLSLSANFGWASSGLCSTSAPLTSGNSCALAADLTPPAAGNYSGSIVLTDDVFNTPQTITMEGVATQPDYSISATPTTLSIVQGQTGTATLTVTPQYGYTGTIQFACSGLPALTTCTFSPTSAAITDNNPVAVTLTVTTTGKTTQASLTAPVSGSGRNSGSPLNLWFVSVGLVSVVLFGIGGKHGKNGRQMVLRMFFVCALLTGVMALNGCGSDSHPAVPVTPVGNYSATVTTTASATAGSGQHTAAITINVTQQPAQ